MTAGMPCCTSVCAEPAKGSCFERAGALAGVQDGDAQRLVIVEQHAQILAADAVAALLLPLEQQHALLQRLIELAVADEVEDVVLGAAQTALQRRERRLLHPLEQQRAGLDQVAERLVEPLPLCLDVERRVVGRARNHHQHADRRGHGNRLHAPPAGPCSG